MGFAGWVGRERLPYRKSAARRIEKSSLKSANPLFRLLWLCARLKSNVETFAAAARLFHVRILELKAFLQAFFGVVQFGAVQINMAFGIDEYFYAVFFKNQVVGIDGVGEFDGVGQARAAAGFHAQAHAFAFAAFFEKVADALGGIAGDGNHNFALSE